MKKPTLQSRVNLAESTEKVIDIDAYSMRFSELRARYDAIMAEVKLNQKLYKAYSNIASGIPKDVDDILIPVAKTVSSK